MEYTTIIGQNIAKLRREKESKQEELAAYAGVSAQAVSKWENGGMPDPYLLPKIADFFNVSIDALYGRNVYESESFCKMLVENTSGENWSDKAFDICSLLIQTPNSDPNNPPAITTRDEDTEAIIISVQSDGYFAKLCNSAATRYFMLMPDYSEKKSELFDCGYHDLFRDLGDENFFAALKYLVSRESDKSFTANLFVKQLGFDEKTADAAIKRLQKYHLISSISAEIDDEEITMYKTERNPSFTAMLTFAKEIAN